MILHFAQQCECIPQFASPTTRNDVLLEYRIMVDSCAQTLRRIKTMSDRALQTRVHRITNVDKLRSFIQVSTW